MGWASDTLFSVEDLFTTSMAENNRNKYRKVIDDLNKELNKIVEKLPRVSKTVVDIHTNMMGNGDASLGKMIINFETKRDDNKRALNKLVSDYESVEREVRKKLKVAEEEYERWSAIAASEDAAKREYQEANK